MRPAALIAQAVPKSVILHIFFPKLEKRYGCPDEQVGGTGKCEKKVKKIEIIMS